MPAESISDVKAPTPTNTRKSLWRNPTVIAAIITSVSAIVIALFSLVPKDKPKEMFVLTGIVYAKGDNFGIKDATLSYSLAGKGERIR